MGRPNNLETKMWYRVVRVVYAIIAIAAFFGPRLQEQSYSGGGWIFDGVINLVCWGILLVIIDQLVVYVAYGRKETGETTNQK